MQSIVVQYFTLILRYAGVCTTYSGAMFSVEKNILIALICVETTFTNENEIFITIVGKMKLFLFQSKRYV
jgi:hypothetical protein